MDIIISNTSSVPIYEQIIAQIKKNIINGNLKEGEALPSMRTLAKELKISVITTKRAYEELENAGFIVTVMGKGSFVAKKNLELIKEEQLKQIEQYIKCAVEQAQMNDIALEELIEIVKILYGEDNNEK
ncbi:GntR family transcriptional regulator [Clostridium sp. MD294]|uniref:GntR family transcriptional regulator n=1 Tax=Clostridium sp. MD294 TaxID=97138 RepID=UPI0002CB4EEE|nr:GntR family transcriptional regulator [Clostridium sp. MD294]NDO47208.1 GntR family transcriptional regulator [Clostridium sp. MD294]USF29728.1 HTH-type transcriptional repressor YtrA [Clostridium sp. MD294]